MLAKLLKKHRKPTYTKYNLTEREYKVLKLISEGSNLKQIANKLKITLSTVNVHYAVIKGKLLVNSRLQIAVKAIKEELL